MTQVNPGVNWRAIRVARQDNVERKATAIGKLKIVKPAKIDVDRITLTRAEGPHELCLTWTLKTFAETSRQIIENSFTASICGAYEKHDFTITFTDGYDYNGTIFVRHPSHEDGEFCIAQHVNDFLQGYIERDDGKDAILKFLATYDIETGTIGKEELDTLIQPAIQDAKDKQEAEMQQSIATAKAKQVEREELITKGKEIAKQVVPADTKALIVAVHDQDNSDLQSDYHGHTNLATVVLGTSKHTRDLFPEMRKHADKIQETAHLAVKPIVDKRGEKKTDDNKDWWHPADEHREKYSMGGGYYLKAGYRHDNGWHIEKRIKYMDEWNDAIYIGLAQRLVLE